METMIGAQILEQMEKIKSTSRLGKEGAKVLCGNVAKSMV